MTIKIPDLDKRWSTCLALALLAILAYLVHRGAGTNPAVFADEWYYSKFSRLSPLAESILPSYLYLWIMRGTSVCGTGFLECGRMINAFAFVAAAPFIYGTARSFTDRPLAVWVALLSTVLPIGSFTAYFMPESIYYFGFCVLSWFVLTQDGNDRRIHAIISGVILGLLSLVKVHALFLLPAMCGYLVYLNASEGSRRSSFGNAIVVAVIAAAAALLAKFGVGYLLVGKAGLSLFGSFYSSTADVAKPTSMADLLKMLYISGRGHVMALVILFAVPLAVILHALAGMVISRRAGPPETRLHVFTFLMLGSALGMTVMYTASIAKLAPAEGLRLHMRYYDFAFPLLLVVAAHALRRDQSRQFHKLAWVIATGAIALMLLAPFRLPNYVQGHVDAPELTAIALRGWPLYTAIAMSLVMLILWVRKSKAAPALFLFLFMPAMAILTETRQEAVMQPLVSETQFDIAGKFIRDTMPRNDRKDLTVMGSGVGQLMRVMFYVDNKDADYIDLPYGAPITREQIPSGKRWALIIEPHAIPEGFQVVTRTDRYVLLEIGKAPGAVTGTTLMNTLVPTGPVARTEGLSEPEPMGRWSNAKQVTLYLNDALPRSATVVLNAGAYGPNVGLPFVIHAGPALEQVTLRSDSTDVAMNFQTDGTVKQITIDVPRPISPQSLGHGDDPRMIGLMLGAVTIKPGP